MSTTYVDGTTPLDAAHMNALQQKVEKGANSGYPAIDSAGFILAPAAGGGLKIAGDTNLYRLSAGVLQTDGQLNATQGVRVVRPAANWSFWTFLASADANPAYIVNGDGTLHWGPGGATAPDTNLYRSAAGYLETDGRLLAGSLVYANAGGGANEVNIGWNGSAIDAGVLFGGDTNLYRSAAGVLRTDGDFLASHNIRSWAGGAGEIYLGGSTGQATIYFGSAYDTNLYRSAAGDLKTDGRFLGVGDVIARLGAVQQVIMGDNNAGAAGLRFGSAGDTNLYRSAAGQIATDSQLKVNNSSNSAVWLSGASAGILFGSAADTNLYRAAAGTLKTDGNLQAAGTYVAGNVNGAGEVLIGAVGPSSQPAVLFHSDTNLYRSGANTIANNNGSAYGTFQAAAFTVSSDRKLKRGIKKATISPEKILSANVYRYKRDDTGVEHVGLMADELPDEVVEQGADTTFVDLYKLTAALVATVQHLDSRIAALEA